MSPNVLDLPPLPQKETSCIDGHCFVKYVNYIMFYFGKWMSSETWEMDKNWILTRFEGMMDLHVSF